VIFKAPPYSLGFFMKQGEHHFKQFLSPETPQTPKQIYVSKHNPNIVIHDLSHGKFPEVY